MTVDESGKVKQQVEAGVQPMPEAAKICLIVEQHHEGLDGRRTRTWRRSDSRP